jgi:hypothetical protein
VPEVVRAEILHPAAMAAGSKNRRRKSPERSTAPPGEVRTRSSGPLP